ncbi:MAG: S1 RNA-binding domain-containing protein [Aigarchaeota archaeon]|nr:S1 RNA-binding domain-containing protein [Aigarchaeota archaeon]MDW8092842.1 S1 RNA-binding domain-containing protein [Nitrososphaerota archaeon]
MSEERPGIRLPEVGELVVATVTKVDRHGASVRLDEYNNLEAYVHISEISLKWVRNVRDFLREGQKTILKVIRSNPQTLQIDASLRRVSQKEFDSKMLEWNRKQKTKRMLELFVEKTRLSPEDLNNNLLKPAEARHIDLYRMFEEIAAGEPIPDWVTIPDDMKDVLVELCKKEIKRSVSVIKYWVKLEARRAGVQAIREAASHVMSMNEKGESVVITIIGAPKYLLRVEAADEERAKRLADTAVEALKSKLNPLGGTVEVLKEG